MRSMEQTESIIEHILEILGSIITALGNFIQTYLTKEVVFPILFWVAVAWIIILIIHRILIYLRRSQRALETVLFRISLPKQTESVASPQIMIASAESFFETLHSFYRTSFKTILFGQEHFSFEIVGIGGGEITFYLAVPRELAEIIKKQINAQYPEAFVEPVEEYNIFRPGYKVVGAQYFLSKKYIYPIRTYQYLEIDPLEAITSAFDRLEKEEGAALQILFRPISSGWHRAGYRLIERIEKGLGIPAGGPIITFFQTIIKHIGRIIFGAPPREIKEEEALIARAVSEKIKKDGWQVAIRVVTSAQTGDLAQDRLNSIESALSQLDWPGVNRIEGDKAQLKRGFITNFIFRFFPLLGKTSILNNEELATLCHFPNTGIKTPHIHWLEARTAPAPENVPKEGTLIGINIFRGERTPVRILPIDRRRHTYIVGKTGMGKSTLLKNMALYDMYDGYGLSVIDPHGDLYDDLLKQIPARRAKDVILFNPSDLDYPVGLNLLEYKTEEEKSFVIEEVIDIFYKLFYQFAGPKFDHYMRNAVITLFADKEAGATLCDIPRLFSSDAFAKTKAVKLKSPVARDFWEKELAALSPAQKSAALGPIIEKIEAFSSSDLMMNILGQKRTTIDFDDLMNNNKILLVNLSKGKLGETNSSLLGLILMIKFYLATLRRASLPEEKRKDFHLYIDEFQDFVTKTIATLFSEARKYRLCLTVSHQYIGQLTQEVAKSVFGNVGTIISFRVGAQDAEFLAPEFRPEFSAFDLVNLPKYNVYVKLMVEGRATPSFSMHTLPPSKFTNEKLAEIIKERSRLKYGRKREFVEKEIEERFKI